MEWMKRAKVEWLAGALLASAVWTAAIARHERAAFDAAWERADWGQRAAKGLLAGAVLLEALESGSAASSPAWAGRTADPWAVFGRSRRDLLKAMEWPVSSGIADMLLPDWPREGPRTAVLAELGRAARFTGAVVADASRERARRATRLFRSLWATAALLGAWVGVRALAAWRRWRGSSVGGGRDSVPADTGRLRMLIADDDPAVRRMLRRFFERSGYEVVTAEDGIEAVAAVGRVNPDVVLLDLYMPGMDGAEALTRIREMAPRLPVTVISGQGNPEMAAWCREVGARDFLPKPLDLTNLELSVSAQVLEAEEPPCRPG